MTREEIADLVKSEKATSRNHSMFAGQNGGNRCLPYAFNRPWKDNEDRFRLTLKEARLCSRSEIPTLNVPSKRGKNAKHLPYAFNRQWKDNEDRFPEDSSFRLTGDEIANSVMCKFCISRNHSMFTGKMVDQENLHMPSPSRGYSPSPGATKQESDRRKNVKTYKRLSTNRRSRGWFMR